jgi:tRNA uracil 4-sulfurtransferase
LSRQTVQTFTYETPSSGQKFLSLKALNAMLPYNSSMTGNSMNTKAKLEPDIVIVRYGELALKSSGVRNWYEKILIKNIAVMLDSRGIPYSQMRREWGRIFIETTDSRTAAKAASDVFGVVSTSPAVTAEPSLEKAARVCAALAQGYIRDGESFAIRARRSGNHPFSSVDIGKTCGDAVWYSLEKMK